MVSSPHLRDDRAYHLAGRSLIARPGLPPPEDIQDFSPLGGRKTHNMGRPGYEEARLQVLGIGKGSLPHVPEQHRAGGMFRLRPFPAHRIMDMQDKLKGVFTADRNDRMRIRRRMVGGLPVMDGEARGPPEVVRHLFVVLQMEADKALYLVEKRRFKLVLRLYIQGRMSRGLAFLVEPFEPGMQGFKLRKLVFGQAQFGAVLLGHGDKIAAPIDHLRFFLGDVVLHGYLLAPPVSRAVRVI